MAAIIINELHVWKVTVYMSYIIEIDQLAKGLFVHSFSAN